MAIAKISELKPPDRKVPNLAHFELISVLFLLLALGRFPLISPQYPKNIQKQFIRPEIE